MIALSARTINYGTMTQAQVELITVSDGTLSYWCGSTLYRIIDTYRERVMDYAGKHPEFKTWGEVVKAYNLQLQPERKPRGQTNPPPSSQVRNQNRVA